MLRSQKRLLKEYLVSAAHNDERAAHQHDKKRLKTALESNRPVPGDLRRAIKLREGLDLEDDETLKAQARDDEYRHAGHYEPRILITTSSDPSQPCVRFAKELKLFFPNSERVNRGQTPEKELVDLCRRDGFTDFIEISGADGTGRPTSMTVCHMPFGPTAIFTVTDVTMRNDLPEKPPHMSGATPNLIFHKFESKTGQRICSILKYLFPLTSTSSQRVVTFANIGDKIVVRHHIWESNSTYRKFQQKDPALEDMTYSERKKLMENIEIAEAGPRFTLIPFRVIRGVIGDKDAETDWSRTSFIRKSARVLA